MCTNLGRYIPVKLHSSNCGVSLCFLHPDRSYTTVVLFHELSLVFLEQAGFPPVILVQYDSRNLVFGNLLSVYTQPVLDQTSVQKTPFLVFLCAFCVSASATLLS